MLTLAAFLTSQLQAEPPSRLDWQTFPAVRAHATVQPHELVFQSIDWQDRIIKGVALANKADKPIVMWLYFGDPRGHC